MRVLMCLVVFLAPWGCAKYSNMAVSLDQQYKDEVECKAQAQLAAGPSGVIFREMIFNDQLVKCLRSRGWTRDGETR
jgi:hypothetical protein